MNRFFRPSRTSSTRWIVAKTLFHTVYFWIIFLGVIPLAIVWLEHAIYGSTPGSFSNWTQMTELVSKIVAAVLFLLASALGIGSGMVMSVQGRGTPLPFDTARKLVLSGPYRWVRNPMAVAGISQAIAVGIWLNSLAVIAYALTGAIIWHFFFRPSEEADLERRFGTQYLAYKTKTPLWTPWP